MIEIITRIVEIVTPGILLACIGIVWARWGPDYPRNFVTTLVLNLCLPALIFYRLTTSELDWALIRQSGLAVIFVQVAMMAAFMVLLRVARRDQSLSIAFTVGNSGNLGLPLCLMAFGDLGLAYAIIYFAIQCVFMFTVGDAVYAGSLNPMRLLKVPVIWAIALAAFVRVFDIPVPSVLLITTDMLGQPAMPIMLITLGVSIAGLKVGNLPRDFAWSMIRTAGVIVIAFLTAELFSLDGVARGVFIIETVVPVAVFNYLLAEKHHRDSSAVSGLVMITHLSALLYLPVILYFIL